MTEAERVRDLIDRLPGKVGMVMAPFYLLMFGIRELFLVARLRRRGLVPAAALILGGSAMLITAVGVVVSAISNPGGM